MLGVCVQCREAGSSMSSRNQEKVRVLSTESHLNDCLEYCSIFISSSCHLADIRRAAALYVQHEYGAATCFPLWSQTDLLYFVFAQTRTDTVLCAVVVSGKLSKIL